MEGKFKIVSNGEPGGTRVYGPDGNELKKVSEITWSVGAGGRAVATITLLDVALEIEGDWKVAYETTTKRELDRSYKPQKVGE